MHELDQQKEKFRLKASELGFECQDFVAADRTSALVATLKRSHSAHSVVFAGGVHGVEMGIASVIFIERLEFILETLGSENIVIIFCMNELGARLKTRETSNSVDLNRNFRDFTQAVESWPFHFSYARSAFTGIGLALHSLLVIGYKKGFKSLAPLLTRGQSKYKFDPYFAGHSPTPEATLATSIFDYIESAFDSVFFFDIHTGFGAYSKLQVLHLYGETGKQRFISFWENESVYSFGDIVDRFDEVMGQKSKFAGTIEFGTFHPVFIFLAIVADNILQRNQKRSNPWKAVYTFAFYPGNFLRWRTKTLANFELFLKKLAEEMRLQPLE